MGVKAVSWRYDPIFITEKYSLDFHLESFGKMAENLHGYADNCVISFIDLYEKIKRNFPGVRKVRREEQDIIGREFVKIGKKYGIDIRSCCEGTELDLQFLKAKSRQGKCAAVFSEMISVCIIPADMAVFIVMLIMIMKQ